VTDYFEGSTLKTVLRSHGPLEPFAAAEIVSDVCGALDYGHQRGRIHGDVGPANVLLTVHGDVRLLNYGIAQYLSHQQAIDDVDARTDVDSAGALLFELVTGTPPTIIFRVMAQQRSAVPPELTDIVEKALRPRQADRYQTAALLRDDLQRMLAQQPL
jgi:eukaryotic-like serine/threonine-protein kinase